MRHDDPERIELWTDPVPQSTRTFLTPSALFPNRTTRNVNRPTLTPFVAEPQTNDTAVIVCPGGGMVMLAVDHEGWAVAEWFQARGTSAYVLEYRLLPTASDDDMYQQLLDLVAVQPIEAGPLGAHAPVAGDDLVAAMRYVKQRHTRVVVVGFSAGARTAYEVATGPAETRPDAVVFAYSPPVPDRPLDDAPPAFVMTAADDENGIGGSVDLFTKWRKAGRPVEYHAYERGQHGFGMVKTNTSTDGWIDDLGRWLQMHTLL